MNKPKNPEHPSTLSINDFTYPLSNERIAQYPLEARDTSKLLIYQESKIQQCVFKELPQVLKPGDALIFNDTRVIHARMFFQRATGAQIEILCLEPLVPLEVNEAFEQTTTVVWKAMVGNAKRWKEGERLTKEIPSERGGYRLFAEWIEKETDAYQVRFTWEGAKTFAEVMDDVGILPLPPYLNRDTEAEDEERYQTVYAQADGSVAAPTAGLHFTQEVLDDLRNQAVRTLFVSLHVGAGTFKPVKAATMAGHEMHQERIHVSFHAIEQMQQALGHNRIIAVGTTSLRTIESIFWFGVKMLSGIEMNEVFVGQWEPYELDTSSIAPADALKAVLDWMQSQKHSYLHGSTQLLIAPGYEIRLADALITNFHQPESTLLLLVSAFIGDDWRNVYDYALKNDFRFLSFGDSSILFR